MNKKSIICFEAPTKPPANVTAVSTSSTSIRVTWKEVPTEDQNGVVQYYHVLYDAPERNVKNQLVKVPNSSLQVQLVDLLKYVKYEIRVRAVTIENGTVSDVVKARTLEDSKNSPRVEHLLYEIGFRTYGCSKQRCS